MLKQLLTLVVLLGFAATASAQQSYPRDITLSWTNPDQYVDFTPIEPGDLESIRVECFRQNDVTPAFTASVADNGEGLFQTETFVGVIPQPGTYNCVAYAIVVGGEESDASNEALKKYTGKPLPPQNFN